MKKILQRAIFLFFVFSFTFLNFSAFAIPTPTCPIVTGRFQGLADGTVADNSSTGWYVNASQVTSTGYFAVKSNRFHAQELGGEGIWYSKVFSVSGYTDFQAAVKVTAEGDMNSSEYVKIYYKINGGAETLLDSRMGNFGTLDFISPTLNGNNIQLVVKIYNYNNGGSQTSKYYIEEYRVFKEHGPCASSIPISITPSITSGVLTCTNSSLTLSASTTATGTTTWSWTGPGSFTSTSQSPSINTPGTYTVVGTNAAGSGSASIVITENKAAPVVTATGGALACATNVILNAASSVSGSAYSWTGPNNFTSLLQNPSVNTAGTYTVTVTNPANGCTTSQSVTVTAGSAAPVTVWTENFTLANGTTSGVSPSIWSSIAPAGVFSVQANEFRVNSIGTTVEGVWTSEAMSITGKTNVSISVGVRSGVSSGGALENSGSSLDYIRMYYKLNSGTEILFSEYLGTINSNSATNTTVSIGSLSGSTLQIVIRARTTSADEFYYFDNVAVTGSSATAIITPSVTGNITCNSTAQLSATITGGTVSAYSWTGPNGFTSAISNPIINAGGQYIVTATLSSGGCSVSAPIMVSENKTVPDIAASGGTLACLSSITLNVSSSVSNASFSWTGPNGFTSTSKNPVVSVAGTYNANVTNPANGCIASQAVTVSSGTTTVSTFWLDDFTLANGTTSDTGSTPWTTTTTGRGTYSVQNNEFKTSFSAAAEGVWTSQEVTISGKSNVSISVNLRSETGSANDAFESDDYIRVYYKLNGGAETLIYDDAAGIGSTTTGTASATATVSSLNGNTLQVIIKTRNSDATEKYFFDNVSLTGADKISESVTATSAGILTCTTALVNLSASSPVSGLSYNWTGPDGFTSILQNPAVSAAGIYTVTVTNTSTGCTGLDTALVVANLTVPGGSANVNGSLSCSETAVTLSGNSATQGVNYSWTGPDSFTSPLQNPSVTKAGTYVLTTSNPTNGCTSTTSVPVTFSNTITGAIWLEDFNLANGTAIDNGNTNWSVSVNPASTVFVVNSSEFRISNSSTTGEGVWTSGSIDITGKTNVSISAALRSAITGSAVMNVSGEFADYIRFYYKLNNGAEVLFAEKTGAINNHSTSATMISVGALSGASLKIVVRARATGNDEFYYFDNVQVVATSQANITAVASAGAILNCNNSSVALSGTSGATDANYNWTGPGGFVSSVRGPVVSAPGDYILTVSSGNCTASDTVTVLQNLNKPSNLAITSSTNSNQLTCLVAALTLTGSSSTAGVTYSWKIPNGTNIPGSVTGAGVEGVYVLTVTDPANGCQAKDTFTVIRNMATPTDAQITPGSGTLTCINTTATLTATNNLAGVTFNWIGPNGFTATGPVAIVSQPGFYNVIMTHPVTGCNHTIGASVISTIDTPANVAITVSSANSQINCINNTVSLAGSSSTAGATYSWTGPNGYSLSGSNALVANPGQYKLTAVNPANGCTSITTYVITQNKTKPLNVTATANPTSGQITCIHPSVLLSGSSATSGVTYAWSGPGGYSASVANATAAIAGSYRLIVTDPANGCPDTTNYTVTQNKNAPVGVVAGNSDQISCYTPSVFVMGSSTTPGAIFSWTGPEDFIPVTTANAETDIPGNYTLLVTNPVNGCTATAFAVVEDHTTPPADVTAVNSGPLNCINTSASLTGNSSTAGVNYTWVAPDSHLIPGAVVSVNVPGLYTLVVTDLDNGCVSTAVTNLVKNTTGCSGTSRATPGSTMQDSKRQQPAIDGERTSQMLQFEYKAYPNPFNSTSFIEFRSPAASLVSIEIFNSQGKKEKVLFNSMVIPGQLYKVKFEAGMLCPGAYYCIIRNNDKLYSSKLIYMYSSR